MENTGLDYVLILFSLLFTTGGQLLQKLSADKALSKESVQPFIKQILVQVETWWAVLCLAIGTILWLLVLYRMEVSEAFPFLSLGYIIVILQSRYYLHETIRPTRWLGVGFICSGILLISVT